MKVRQMVRAFAATVIATVREIFDEAAYARFLERTGMAWSAQSYAEFCLEREEGFARRTRCC